MSKPYVPAAPLPTWRNPAQETNLQRPPYGRAPAASKHIAPLDAAFVSRTFVATLWLGALLAIVAYGLTHSLWVVCSFSGGVVLSAGMLKSQQSFVTYLVQRWQNKRNHVAETRWLSRIPAWVLPPAKYLVIFTGLGLLLHHGVIEPLSFVAGYTLLQFVIVARTLGRLMVHRTRPLNEIYVRRDINKRKSDVR